MAFKLQFGTARGVSEYISQRRSFMCDRISVDVNPGSYESANETSVKTGVMVLKFTRVEHQAAIAGSKLGVGLKIAYISLSLYVVYLPNALFCLFPIDLSVRTLEKPAHDELERRRTSHHINFDAL